ncbi:hypothetical protein OIU77_007662 [Salix suchowensis]|uniref:Uncharacterized protein n=1 Tax=Salix suchowensis TaxID=1278906 RepID=A0ABQ9AH19_9ROSI|nr:hypothetical protein OIU77_007662 [Salix suchowensis]
MVYFMLFLEVVYCKVYINLVDKHTFINQIIFYYSTFVIQSSFQFVYSF